MQIKNSQLISSGTHFKLVKHKSECCCLESESLYSILNCLESQILIPIHLLGKSGGDGPSLWILLIQIKDLCGATGFCH